MQETGRQNGSGEQTTHFALNLFRLPRLFSLDRSADRVYWWNGWPSLMFQGVLHCLETKHMIAACWICVLGRCRHVLDVAKRSLCSFPSSHHREVSTWREVGSEMIDVPQNLTLSPYSHWAVYTKSSLVEQSTPASLLIYAAWFSAWRKVVVP